jgi:hypothetical protein
MPGRFVLSLRVLRCPACDATVPVRGTETVVVCEYCNAHLQVVRAREPASPSPPAAVAVAAPQHVATPHYSGCAWVFLIVILLVAGGVAYALHVVGGLGTEIVEAFSSSTRAPAESTPPSTDVVVGDARETPPAGGPASVHVEPPSEEAAPPAAGDDPPAAVEPEPARGGGGSKRPEPSGPVISVSEAGAQLEPKVLACMRQARVHSILAYMGNKTVGPVSVLSDSRTRVDGRLKQVGGTALGRCMNDAGRTVRTRATKSNYVRFELTNNKVPDPLAKLPAKADRGAIVAKLDGVKPKIDACARKHDQVGKAEVFYLKIDGPSGKVLSARGSYGSKAFRRCAEPILAGLRFHGVRESVVSFTHRVQL